MLLFNKIGRKNFYKILIKDSYNLLLKVLKTENNLSTNEKNILKNLGSWIG